MAPGLYGVLVGIAVVVFTKLMPQPLGSIVLWALISAQLSWGAVNCWRRTGLPFATAAMITAALLSTCLLTLAVIGRPYPTWPPEAWVLFAGVALLGPLFLFIESRVNRTKWKEWAHHMEQQTVWDIAIGRHFPQLRNRGV